ncbi:MAG: hypothetical protein IKY11_05020 [Rikenellaceae bacterium]|nr:hypothetical protein [Rikenellaceae bacterium]
MKKLTLITAMFAVVVGVVWGYPNPDNKEIEKQRKQLVLDSLSELYINYSYYDYKFGYIAQRSRSVIARGDTVSFRVKTRSGSAYETHAKYTYYDGGYTVYVFEPLVTEWCQIGNYGARVVVVDPKDYDKVIARMNKLEGNEKNLYLDSLAGHSAKYFKMMYEPPVNFKFRNRSPYIEFGN